MKIQNQVTVDSSGSYLSNMADVTYSSLWGVIAFKVTNRKRASASIGYRPQIVKFGGTSRTQLVTCESVYTLQRSPSSHSLVCDGSSVHLLLSSIIASLYSYRYSFIFASCSCFYNSWLLNWCARTYIVRVAFNICTFE